MTSKFKFNKNVDQWANTDRVESGKCKRKQYLKSEFYYLLQVTSPACPPLSPSLFGSHLTLHYALWQKENKHKLTIALLR